MSRPRPRTIYRSVRNRTGRRWEVMQPSRYDGVGNVSLYPLGGDAYRGGGVRIIRVSVARLNNRCLWERIG